jgi:hypothetical protein
VLVDDRRARDREALAGSHADRLGGEERLEDLVGHAQLDEQPRDVK